MCVSWHLIVQTLFDQSINWETISSLQLPLNSQDRTQCQGTSSGLKYICCELLFLRAIVTMSMQCITDYNMHS